MMDYKSLLIGAVLGAIAIGGGPAAGDILYADFSSMTGLSLVGDAAQVGSALRVAPAASFRVGAAWHVTPQRLSEGFETSFVFRITDRGLGPADGLAFVVQNDNASAIGGFANGIGYGTAYDTGSNPGIPNSLAVEFDTFDNWRFGEHPDGEANHISVNTRGTARNHPSHEYSLGCASPGPYMADSNPHTAKVAYAPGTMSVYLDDLHTPVLTVAVDLSALLDLDHLGRAWVGFTAGTGGLNEDHDIESWSFTEIPEPATLLLICGAAAPVLLKRRRS